MKNSKVTQVLMAVLLMPAIANAVVPAAPAPVVAPSIFSRVVHAPASLVQTITRAGLSIVDKVASLEWKLVSPIAHMFKDHSRQQAVRRIVATATIAAVVYGVRKLAKEGCNCPVFGKLFPKTCKKA